MSVAVPRPPAADRRNRLIGVATFAGGSFRSVERVFREVPGVIETTRGYTGGTVANPSYARVATGITGHAEAVRVEFDPARVSYEELLQRFWSLHDPTRPRVGRRSRFRSAIFVHSPEQERAAQEALAAQEAVLGEPVVTEICRAELFYQADDEPR
ncbi:MAG TPA: peptide-methionine (S)-S-oxide reductase MsrA [Gaiellaceae bacterium]|nr:peptide-methionine (S)-S-oxide reductase MsrA [Gaiellaceae bacterium]